MADSIFVPQVYTQGVLPQYQNTVFNPSNNASQQQSGRTNTSMNSSGSSFGSNFGSNGLVGQVKDAFGNIKTGINTAVDKFGTSIGFAPASTYYTTAGSLPWQTAGSVANPFMAGSSGVATGTTLSGALSGAGIGSLVGGLVGGGGMGSNVGGAVGGAIGNAVLPGFGGVIGGALGGIAGGLFGGKPKAKVSIFSNSTDAQGNMGDKAYIGSKTLDGGVGNETFSAVSPYLKGLASVLGPLKPVNVVGGTHSKWGGNFIAAVPGDKATESEDVPKEYLRNFKDEASFGTAVDSMLRDVAKYSGYDDKQIDSALAALKQQKTLGQPVGSTATATTPPASQIMLQQPSEGNFTQFLKDYKARMNVPANSPAAAL